ncbi:hypothetical protein BLNAU_11645 [Blattamonas nauphoetae]|uniref:Protein kinase domain-containing protein n=1 Tax=Blattamonas nauphoetae TaxID=2049346 RepID=A0ABQ9XPC4_9EUKA|nr:hypothetical protein BLNAU_11645 [Blattamonas nauphoetae]
MTSTIGEMGTFEYNSPERLLDSKGTATPASDVWSLGVLAYRMVTGNPLFEGLTLPQLCFALTQFTESRIPTTIPASVRAVLLTMLEPNVALRASTSALLEGGLLEGMLGSSTHLSRMKSIQLASRVNEIHESLNDARVKERTMELEMEKQKLLDETQELTCRLRSLQLSLERTRSRNVELEKEEELEQRQHFLTTHTSPISIDAEDNVLSTKIEMPKLQFYKNEDENEDESSYFDVSENNITKTGVDKHENWSTTLVGEPISEGMVSAAITILAMPKSSNSEQGLMFGLVDALSRKIHSNDQLGEDVPGSIALAPRKGKLHIAFRSSEPTDIYFRVNETTKPISAPLSEGDRVVLEVDMDARPRTAVYIINGNVPLTFVSGLPPSIRFGLSMKNEGVSVRFDGMSRLKRATPLRRVNEIKWNLEDMRDSEDMYMNGLRSSVLTVQTQMPSLVFTDPSHFRVEDNIIASTGLATKENDGEVEPTWSSFFISQPISEGIVAISFTPLVTHGDFESYFGLINEMTPIPEKGQKLGEFNGTISLSSMGQLHFLTEKGQKTIDVSTGFWIGTPLIVEINLDSNPRTTQFFVDGECANAVIVGLPESVRVGFSTKDRGTQVRLDRITNLNRGSPITDQMKVIKWPTTEPPCESDPEEDLDEKVQERTSEGEEKEEKDSLDEANVDEHTSQEDGRSQKSKKDDDQRSQEINNADDEAVDDGDDADEDAAFLFEWMMQDGENEKQSDGDSDEDTDADSDLSESDSDVMDVLKVDETRKIQLPTMKLPELLFTDKSHFIIRNNVVTRTEKGEDKKGKTRPNTVLLSEPVTKGVVSVTFDVLSLAEISDETGFISIGFLDSSAAVPRFGRVLGKNVKHSVGLSTRYGFLHVNNLIKQKHNYSSLLRSKTRVVMEVNMDSTPRTVQFFVNGTAGPYYVSGLPESVRIGFSAHVMGTSLEIPSITHSTQATPLADKMKEIRWTDTAESLKERYGSRNPQIRREAEGSMPALLLHKPKLPLH